MPIAREFLVSTLSVLDTFGWRIMAITERIHIVCVVFVSNFICSRLPLTTRFGNGRALSVRFVALLPIPHCDVDTKPLVGSGRDLLVCTELSLRSLCPLLTSVRLVRGDISAALDCGTIMAASWPPRLLLHCLEWSCA